MFVFHRIPCRELHCWFIQFIPKSRKTQCKNIAKKWSIHGFYFHPLTPVHSHAIPSKHRDGTPLQFSGIIISVQSSRSALKRWGRNTGNTHKKPRLYYVILCYIMLYIVIYCYIMFVCHISHISQWFVIGQMISKKRCTKSQTLRSRNTSRLRAPTCLGYRRPLQSPDAVRATNPRQRVPHGHKKHPKSWRTFEDLTVMAMAISYITGYFNGITNNL